MASKRTVQAEATAETTLVPVAPTRRPPTLAPAPEALPMDWPTNFDLTTSAGKAGLINSGNPPVWRPQDGGTYIIRAVNWVVCPGESMDEETGAVSVFTQTVLIAKDGTNVKMSSDWAPRRLRAMLSMYSPQEWAAGITIECYTGQSRRQGRLYGSFRVLGATATENGEQ